MKYEQIQEDCQMVAAEDCYVPDCLFPTDNDWEVPTLREDMQPEVVDIPAVLFGEQKRTFQMNGCGTLHFYCDDYRFSSVYEHPEKIVQHHPRNIIEPNFSMFNEMPSAFGLQAVYKKRFIARAMQEKGIRVFVDLNVAQKFYKLNLMGVPPGYRAFATRGYSDRLPALELEYRIAEANAALKGNKPLFLCYGGGRMCQGFCKEVGAVYITPIVGIKHKEKAWAQLMQDNCIAFTDADYSKAAIEASQKQLRLDQIIDYNNQKQIEQ